MAFEEEGGYEDEAEEREQASDKADSLDQVKKKLYSTHSL
jgi:hypothetical protein